MPKSFEQAFQEWKEDNRYSIGEDIGAEYYDDKECPTHSDSSLAKDNGKSHST
jgi:hypothetical protein